MHGILYVDRLNFPHLVRDDMFMWFRGEGSEEKIKELCDHSDAIGYYIFRPKHLGDEHFHPFALLDVVPTEPLY